MPVHEQTQESISYIGTHPTITSKKFVARSGLKRFYASGKLVLLMLAHVLNITSNAKDDLYSPAPIAIGGKK